MPLYKLIESIFNNVLLKGRSKDYAMKIEKKNIQKHTL